MERLTEKQNDKLFLVKQDNGEFIPCYWDEDNFMAIDKLNAYEDLEEQGLLVRLPISIGATVYTLASSLDCVYNYDNCKAVQKWKCEEDIQCEYEKKSYYIKEVSFSLIMLHSIGTSVFLTREEAEKKFEEMENGKK